MKGCIFLLPLTAACLSCAATQGQEPAASGPLLQRLRASMPTRATVDSFLSGKQGPEKLSRNSGWVFDADLGWALCDATRLDGVDKSRTFYHYEADGARKVVNFPDRACRIHTYGDSFTHCDQVSDGETWQEYLAAHLQEPIRNFGVGGYSAYQAYCRIRKVEEKYPAKYIILNIFDDDHYRNLDSLRSIRLGRKINDGFTLPYLRVDVARGRCQEVPNLLRTPEDVYRLCDEKFVYQTFKDDPVLRLALAGADKKPAPEQIESIAAGFGIPKEQLTESDAARQIEKIHTRAALLATKHVVTLAETYTTKTGKKLLIVLSFNQRNVRDALEGKPRFDQELIDWLNDRPYPVIDMRDAFRREFAQFKCDISTFLARYYHGHHSPLGNFFTAWALKDALVKWLEPAPLPYRRSE